MSNYVHHIPGRLRVRSAVVKKNEVKASAAKTLLEAAGGVKSVDVNVLTGSIVIRYDPKLTNPSALMVLLRDRGYLGHATFPPRPSPAVRHRVPLLASEAGAEIAKNLARYVVETAVERSVVAVVAALL